MLEAARDDTAGRETAAVVKWLRAMMVSWHQDERRGAKTDLAATDDTGELIRGGRQRGARSGAAAGTTGPAERR